MSTLAPNNDSSSPFLWQAFSNVEKRSPSRRDRADETAQAYWVVATSSCFTLFVFSPTRGTGLPLQVELPPSGSVFSKWVFGITHSDLLHSSCDSFITLVLFWKHISLLQNAMLLCMWLCVCADWEVEMLVGKQLVDQPHSQSFAFSYGWSSRVLLRTRSI